MPLTTVSPGMLDTTAQYYGFKNRIINGAMVIDQRNAGASFTSNGLFYCVDRWLLQAVGAANTAQQVTGSTGNNKAVRITGNTSNTLTGFSQRIEAANIYDCANQTVTVSFTLFGSASGSVSVRFLYPTATDNYTSTTEPVAGTTVNFTTTATQYSVTRTLDSNANKGVWVYFDFGALGSGVTRTIEFVQLEKGSTATSFDYRPYGTELALCQRYYERLVPASGSGLSLTFTGTIVPDRRSSSFGFKVSKRAAPSLVLYGSGSTTGQVEVLATGGGGSNANYSSIQSNTEGFWVIVNGGSGTGLFAFYSPSYADIEL